MTRIALICAITIGFCSYNPFQSTASNKAICEQQEKIYSRYCIVVGSFRSEKQATQYGSQFVAKGHEVFYQESGNGYYRVCLYRLNSESEARQKMDELKKSEKLITQCWVNGFDEQGVSKNSSIASTHAPTTLQKEKQEPQKSKPLPVADKPRIEEKKSITTPSSPKEEPKTSVTNIKEKISYTHYCLVVGNFALPDKAKQYGDSLQSKGYNVFVRKIENGNFGICMYNMDTEADAIKRMDKMKHIDRIFLQARILGYNNLTENIRIDQL